MTRKLNEIIDEAYDIFVLCHDKFANDKRWKGNYHYEWIAATANITEKILISERIEDSKNAYYDRKRKNLQSDTNTSNHEEKVTVRLTDGNVKTIDVKDQLNQAGWYWNKPEGSYDWNKIMSLASWETLKNTYPFNKLTVKIEQEVKNVW